MISKFGTRLNLCVICCTVRSQACFGKCASYPAPSTSVIASISAIVWKNGKAQLRVHFDVEPHLMLSYLVADEPADFDERRRTKDTAQVVDVCEAVASLRASSEI